MPTKDPWSVKLFIILQFCIKCSQNMLLWCVHVQYMRHSVVTGHWKLTRCFQTSWLHALLAHIACGRTCVNVYVRMLLLKYIYEHCAHAHALYWQTCTQGTDIYIHMCVHTVPPSIFYILHTTALTRLRIMRMWWSNLQVINAQINIILIVQQLLGCWMYVYNTRNNIVTDNDAIIISVYSRPKQSCGAYIYIQYIV